MNFKPLLHVFKFNAALLVAIFVTAAPCSGQQETLLLQYNTGNPNVVFDNTNDPDRGTTGAADWRMIGRDE